MTQRKGVGLASLFVFTGLCFPAGQTWAAVTDLTVTKSSSDVVLTWSTGTTPHRVLRSRTATFISGNKTVAQGVTTGTATDTGVVGNTETYFYQVLDANDANPSLFELNPPRPVPTITMISPGGGQPGTTVTITGQNFATDGSGMVVMFGDVAGDVVSATATQVVVTVPTGTVTGDVTVCVADACSNQMQFTVTVGPTTQDVSSLAFEVGTGSLWFGDRGSIDQVIEVTSAGTSVARANQNEAFISNVSPGNGSGRVYYSNGVTDTNNQGTIRYVNSLDNTTAIFRAAGTSGTDPVRARGLAARDDEADVVYFLDGNLNTVRRVPLTGTIDKNWGNTTFAFNNPAGARFDSNGNLYVTSTTAIYKIAPNEAVTLVASGFSGAAGLDLSEDTGIATLLVADKAAGRVYLVNTEDGSKDLVGEGFSNPQAVSFSRSLTTSEFFYDVAEPTRILRLPDPRVDFAVKSSASVLTRKVRTEDQYPSPFQSQDRKIIVEATVSDGKPKSGITVYFRAIDPKDKAPYASTGVNDNKGGASALSVTSAVSDSAGKVRTELTVTDTFSGDNYQIEASLDAPPNFKKIARSGVFTAWKRGYVEYDRMLKVGQFINQTSGAGQADPKKVFVATPATFTVGDQVVVLSGETSTTAEGETRTVSAIATDHIVLNTALANTYTYTGPNPPDSSFPYSYVGRIAGGTYDVTPTAQLLAQAFDDPFTEWYFVSGNGYIPGWTTISSSDIDARSFLFFKELSRTPAVVPTTNHAQLVAAGAATPSTTKGLTQADNAGATIASNWSWVFTTNITTTCSGCSAGDITNFTNDVTTHELGHQWNVNVSGSGGHDSENAWNSGTRKCLMNESRSPTLAGIARFHANLAAPSKDLYCIRGHVDDLNQDTCSW